MIQAEILTAKAPPPIRRHESRDDKCACQSFMVDGASAAGRMEVSCEPSEDILQISITDNGVGMSQETIEKVLKGDTNTKADFFRHVGISNVNQRIQYDFGEEYGIRIKSSPGRYTTMIITLPCRFLENS